MTRHPFFLMLSPSPAAISHQTLSFSVFRLFSRESSLDDRVLYFWGKINKLKQMIILAAGRCGRFLFY